MISARIRHRQGDFVLDVAFEADAGVTALFGPSGSGKTSLVQAIAGLVRPDEAVVSFDGRLWNDTGRRIFVPPHRRRIGYVFQEGRLFPHLTARQNLLYGRFFAPAGESRISEEEVVALLGIGRLLPQRPATLSGGEKQRVAIGRALLSAPSLILMDEPLSALDRPRRQEILPYIERIRDEVNIPIIYVSHALDEVARLAGRVVLLEDGRVRAEGTPQEVFPEISSGEGGYAPQSIILARIIGHEPRFGLSVAAVAGSTITVQQVDLPEGTPVRIRLAATDVMLALERHADLSALNQIPATIVALEETGHHVLVSMDCHGQRLASRVTLLSAERLKLRSGLELYVLFKTVSVDPGAIYPAPGTSSRVRS